MKVLIATGFVAFFAFTTFLRAQEWSHPLRLANSEALKRPNSPRAQYELARMLIVAAGSHEKSPLIDESIKILQRDAFLPNSGIAPLQALIFINGHAHRAIDPAWWQAIGRKLQDNPPSQTDIDSIVFLYRCQLHGDCPTQKQEMLDTLTAALSKSEGNVYLMSAYAEFAVNELGDALLAERMDREVVAVQPQIPVYRANLVHLLIATQQFDAAETAITELTSLNHLGSLDPMIFELRARLAVARSTASPVQSALLPDSPANR